MDVHAECVDHSEGDGHGKYGCLSQPPTGLHDLLEKSFPLIAEDLRATRVGLGITSLVAAERAELDPALYHALEEGGAVRNVENLGLMLLAAKCLGLEEVRFSYIEEVQQQYMKVDLSTDGPLVIFLDRLSHYVQELKEQSLFVSPHHVLALVDRNGFYETFASNQLADKQLIELWTAAVLTLCLSRGRNYYVGLAKDDPPDTEVLELNAAGSDLSVIKIEITRHGSHSRDLVDLIGKKLCKKYEEGTVLAVLVEQQELIDINELDDFIRANNPYNQRIFIIGGSDAPGSFKVVPWDEVTRPTPGETAWLEIGVDVNNVSGGYRGYEGVVLKSQRSQSLPPYPVFVRELELRR